MKQSKLTGWLDVFKFTLIQTLKSKAYLVSFVIMLLISVGAVPVMGVINKGQTEESDVHIQKIYIDDELNLSKEGFLPILESDSYKTIQIVPMTQSYDEVEKLLNKKESNSVILKLQHDLNTGFTFTWVRAKDSDVKKQELGTITEEIKTQFLLYRAKSLGISKEQDEIVHADIVTKVTKADVTGTEVFEKDTRITDSQYWVLYALSFVSMMIVSIACSQIASGIASDKSTRVIEYLLTSIKPLALLVGKVLAMLVAVILEFGVIIGGVLLSDSITSSVLEVESMVEKYLPSEVLANVNIINLLLVLVILLLGLTFYAVLAGLAGATVSKIEELKEGMTLFTIAMLVGVYLAIIASSTLMGAGENTFTTFVMIFPLSSPFMLPGAIMIGKISVTVAIISIVLLVVSVLLLFKFTARLYETLILYNGTVIKTKQLLGLSKKISKEEKQNAK